MEHYGETDIGRLRHENEDAFVCQALQRDDCLLCAAIDGIGGNEGGGMAAEIVRDTLTDHIDRFPSDSLAESLKAAAISANNEVIRFAQAIPKYHSMGCVMSAGIVDAKRLALHVAHIGDTRIYLLRGGHLSLLTSDAVQGPFVTKYIGKRQAHYGDALFDFSTTPLAKGDTLLFCSDGLWKMVDEQEMAALLTPEAAPEGVCHRLIKRANENGGKDNVTAIVVKI